METKKEKISLELRSEEVQELMGKIPPMILRFGIGIILMILLLFFVASYYVKYPVYESVSVVFSQGSEQETAMPVDGTILEIMVGDGEQVRMHDTLAIISGTLQSVGEAVALCSSVTGVAYACDFFEKGETIRQGTPLFVVRQNARGLLKGKCYVGQEAKQHLSVGKEIECLDDGVVVRGRITRMAEIRNSAQGGYAVEILFDDDGWRKNRDTESDTVLAKIKTSDKTIFELFFLKSVMPKF